MKHEQHNDVTVPVAGNTQNRLLTVAVSVLSTSFTYMYINVIVVLGLFCRYQKCTNKHISHHVILLDLPDDE